MARRKFTRAFQRSDGPLSHTTRNEYAVSITGFSRWAYARRKIAHDPLLGLARVDEKAVEAVHPRRALTLPEIVALLDAAQRRPEADLRTVRRGKHKGEPLAVVRTQVLEEARRIGQCRRMAYLTAIWTGLRRSELTQLQWGDLHLEVAVPNMQLRAQATKSRRADIIPLHPQLVEELLAYRPPVADCFNSRSREGATQHLPVPFTKPLLCH